MSLSVALDLGPNLIGSDVTIDSQALSTAPDNLLAYWPLNETSGSVARDLSGNNRHGAYGGAATVGGNTFIDGSPCVSVNGGHINIYSASLAAAFNAGSYSIAGWFKTSLGNWPSGDYICQLYVDASNHVNCTINAVYPLLSHLRRAAGSPSYANVDGYQTGEWVHVAIGYVQGTARRTWVNGALEYSGAGSANTLSGSIASTTSCLGAANTSDTGTLTDGLLRGWGIWDTLLSDAQIAAIYNAVGRSTNMFFIGDSKTTGDRWTSLLRANLIANTIAVYANPAMYATAGWTLANVKTALDAGLAAESATPSKILINIGSNGAEAENDFKTDLRYVIELLHAKWTSAIIYIARPVVLEAAPPSTPTAANAAKRGWIDDVIGEYSYVASGLDETDLEGGDGYATNLADETHYTDAGQLAVPPLWIAAF